LTDRLYDALEICLNALDQGQNIDLVLKRFPEFAAELRPILEASLHARRLRGHTVPQTVQRRGRARLLQRAAQMRKPAPALRWVNAFPRLAAALGLAIVFVLSGTGLISASASSLPGDQLYPVKRTWEGVQLTLVFNQQSRDALQSRFDQERLNEISELLNQNRSEQVAFSGLLTKQSDGTWLISNIPVRVTEKTQLPSGAVSSSAPVAVIGMTGSNGILEADEIQELQPGVLLPPLGPSENRGGGDENAQIATPGFVQTQSPGTQQATVATTSQPRSTSQSFAFKGVVENIQGNVWVINGQKVYVDQAEVNGRVDVGAIVKFQGFYSEDGKYVATDIQVVSQGNEYLTNRSSGGSGNDKGGNDGEGSDDHGGGSGD